MKIKQIPVGPMENLSYLIWDKDTGSAAIIDPAWDEVLIKKNILSENVVPEFILLTHAHPDHINKVQYFLEEYPSLKVVMHKDDLFLLENEFKNSLYVKNMDILKIGSEEIQAIHTPGHTPGSVCYKWKNVLFTGDTLFIGCCGRVDLPSSDPEAMRQSLIKIFSFPDETEMYPGHSYNGFKTTIKAQKIANICYKYLNDKEEFYSLVL